MQVPSRLIVFPDENHWILKGEDSRLFYAEIAAWLDRWLKPASRKGVEPDCPTSGISISRASTTRSPPFLSTSGSAPTCRSKRGRGCCGSGCSCRRRSPMASRPARKRRRLNEIGEALDATDLGDLRRATRRAHHGQRPSRVLFLCRRAGRAHRFGRERHEGFRGIQVRDRQHFPARVGAVPHCCIPPRPISNACRTAACSRRWRSRATRTKCRARSITGCTSAMKPRARPAARRWWRSISPSKTKAWSEEDGGDHALRAGGVARRQRGYAHHQRHHARARAPGRRILRALRRLGVRRSRATKARSSKPREFSASPDRLREYHGQVVGRHAHDLLALRGRGRPPTRVTSSRSRRPHSALRRLSEASKSRLDCTARAVLEIGPVQHQLALRVAAAARRRGTARAWRATARCGSC